MYKPKVLVGCVLLVYVLFAICEFNGNESLSLNLDCLITPLIALIYVFFAKRRNIFFLLFILCYSISDLLCIIVSYIPEGKIDNLVTIDYFVGNLLFILAYIFLVIKISKSLSLFYVLRNFKIHLVVLTILNVYLVYVLQVILSSSLYLENEYEYYLEMIYNIVMLLLLSVALLNYFYRDNKKSLYLFIGALCIVFSEVMQVAYFYIAQRNLLNFISTTLTLIAFYFFYQQSKLLNNLNEEERYMVVE